MTFALDDRLGHDALVIGDLTLCRALMMNDDRWPWLILVPRREGLVELTDLDPADQTQLMDEAGRAAHFLKSQARADKINVGALGNIVRASSACCGEGHWRSGMAGAGVGDTGRRSPTMTKPRVR